MTRPVETSNLMSPDWWTRRSLLNGKIFRPNEMYQHVEFYATPATTTVLNKQKANQQRRKMGTMEITMA